MTLADMDEALDISMDEALWRYGYKPLIIGAAGNKRMAIRLREIADGFERADIEGRGEAVWTKFAPGRNPVNDDKGDWLLLGGAAGVAGHLYRIVYDDCSKLDGYRATAALCVVAREIFGGAYLDGISFYAIRALAEALPLARALVERGRLRGDIDINAGGPLAQAMDVKGAGEIYDGMWQAICALNDGGSANIGLMIRWCRAAADYLQAYWDGEEFVCAPAIVGRSKASVLDW